MAEMIHKLSLETLVLKVKIPKTLPLRMWIAKQLIRCAALVLGCSIEIADEAAAIKPKQEK